MGNGRKVNGGGGFLRQNWLEVISRDHPHDVSNEDVHETEREPAAHSHSFNALTGR
jgi:hypothetical protein